MTNASRAVVLIAEKLAPSVAEEFGTDVEIRHVDGTDREALLDAVAEADALLVRSSTQVDSEVLGASSRLKVVGRAGVGLDNVDVPAATERGVLVVNAPTSNIVSAAEHAVALLLAVARNVAAADASLRAGEWKRSSYTGVELHGKTIGVVGLGKIGQLFAQRVAAFGTDLIAYDPYLPAARAARLGIELVGLEELLERADAISVHLPKTAETVGLIGAEELKKARKAMLVVNAARGGLIDEGALADALRNGHIGGAGIDVYETEPTTSSPLFELANVVATPHLGASTAEAQDRAGTDVARSVLLALAGDFVPDAVNVRGGAVGEEVLPYLPLTEKLGSLLSALSAGTPSSLVVEAVGELASEDVSVLGLAALRGLFTGVVDSQVTFVNAPRLAEEFGVDVEVKVSQESPDHRSAVSLRAVGADGRTAVVSGALTGPNQVEKLVEVDGRHFDFRIEGDVLLLECPDRPGVMGRVGTLLGETGANIHAAAVSQTSGGSDAIMLLRVDRPVQEQALEPIGKAVDARIVRAVSFSDHNGK
ncbi:phosphoglycerate dehydrogenase [Saccharopolyspora erythraea]|uniref:phosphoglycerate dehydrogenase n=1 Tax=Saccharopolyspora erythraea TaxID=1836 RepID=UPI001BA900C2|nr:phosphoglycerate dehydrogenase [Saccharopolyspora erythraea]QUH02203.1 phosphoglycerate dehydrogenase [Saccharopolyspora erythraea]